MFRRYFVIIACLVALTAGLPTAAAGANQSPDNICRMFYFIKACIW